MYLFIIGFYFLGHLLRIFVGKRYKDSRYKNIFNFLKNKQFIDDYDKYKRKTQTFSNTSSNPYHLPLLKNIFRLIFFICFYLAIILVFVEAVSQDATVVKGSIENRIDLLKDIFLPSISETSYQLTDISHVLADNYDHTVIYGDYFSFEGDFESSYKVFDMDYNLKFDNSHIQNLESFGVRDIIDQYMLIIAKFSYSDDTEIIIYNLETSEIVLQINADNFPISNSRKIRSDNFEIVDNKFYLTINYYLDDVAYDEETYYNGVLEIDEDDIIFHDVGIYALREITYFNDHFYYIVGLHDLGEFYSIGKSDKTINKIELSNETFTYARSLMVYEDKLYLNVYSMANELIYFDENFNFTSVGLGLSKPYYSSSQNLFLFGSDKTSFIEYDVEGYVINQGISCDECNGNLLFYMDNQELYALSDSNTLYHFSKTTEPFKYFNNTYLMQDVIPKYNPDIDSLYTYVIAVMLSISSISYFIMIKSLFVKYNTNEFFDLIQK